MLTSASDCLTRAEKGFAFPFGKPVYGYIIGD